MFYCLAIKERVRGGRSPWEAGGIPAEVHMNGGPAYEGLTPVSSGSCEVGRPKMRVRTKRKSRERYTEAAEKIAEKYLVAMRAGETPVPIPNTKVKACAAENTMPETAWEDRWLPNYMGL